MTPEVHAVLLSPATLGWGLFLFAIVWALRSAGSPERGPAPDWKWWLLLAGVMLCFRWPLIWVPYELNPDESLMIAGGITLRHDPLFWRSVDCGTAGPLDVYPLLLTAFTPAGTGYAVARIAAILMIAGLMGAVGESLACVANRATARLAVLPLLAFEAFTTNPEFVHYSTELVPDLMLAVSVCALVRQRIHPAAAHVWLAGTLLGAVPFAKPQAGPIAVLLWVIFAGWEWLDGRRSNLRRLLIGALLPALVIALVVAAAGETENVLIPYFLNNFAYVEHSRHGFGDLVQHHWNVAAHDGYQALWLVGTVVYLVGALAVVRRPAPLLRQLQLAALAILVTAIFCVFAPGRNFDHYMNLLALPLCWGLGLALAAVLQAKPGASARRQQVLAGVFLACGLLPQVALRASPRTDPFAWTNFMDRGPAYRELARAVLAISQPGESLGLWGWRSSLYVETRLRQATRQAANGGQLISGKWQKYYLDRYLADLQAASPAVFVDTTGAGNFAYRDRIFAHESFPQLHEWVRTRYSFFGEVDEARIYVRNDRYHAAESVWPPGRRKP